MVEMVPRGKTPCSENLSAVVGRLHVLKENEVLVKWIGYEVVVAAWVARSKAATMR